LHITAKFHHPMFGSYRADKQTHGQTVKQTDVAENIHLATVRGV